MTQYLKTIIVEDEVNNSELLKYFLNKYCPMLIVVGVADSIQGAKDLIKLKKPDLVFLDIIINEKVRKLNGKLSK